MSLKLNRNRDMHAYLQLGNFQTALRSYNMLPVSGLQAAYKWIDFSGTLQAQYNDVAAEGGSGTGFNIARIDTQLLDTTSSAVGSFSPDNVARRTLWVGDFEPATGTQRYFGHLSPGGDTPYGELNIANPSEVLASSVFPKVSGSFPNSTDFPLGTEEGYWQMNLAGGEGGSFVWFPEQGGTGHLIIARCQFCILGGIQIAECSVDVDLTTGFGTPIVGLPSINKTTPSNTFQGPALFGESEIIWKSVQFIPDSDSTHINPKGLMLFSAIPIEVTPDVEIRYYVKFVDWNPEGVSGNPTRTHLLERLVSRARMDFPASDTAVLPSPPLSIRLGDADAINVGNYLVLDTRRNVLVMPSSAGIAPEAYPNTAGSNALIEFSTAADISQIRNPAPLGAPDTGRVVQFNTEARGDLGELIGGVNLNWSLIGASTEDETISNAGPVDSTRLVDFPPVNLIDDYPREVRKRDPSTSETITSVTDNGGIAQFQFTAPPALSVGQRVVITGFVTNTTYNVTAVTTAVGAGFFEISSVAFTGSEASVGSFTFDIVLTEGAGNDYQFVATGVAFENGIDPDGASIYTVDYSNPDFLMISSVTDSSSIARFNFLAGPTLVVGQEVNLREFSTATYNATGLVSVTGAGFFEIAAVAFVEDDTGFFQSDSITVPTPHGSLLTASSVTDALGLASSRVQYADSSALVGLSDKIRADTVS